MTSWSGNSALQVLPDSRKSRQNVGGLRSRQDVGGSGPAGTAVFQTAYGPHHQLSTTLGADAFRAAPDNAGQPPGLIPVVYANGDTGPMRSAARSFQVPTQRVGTRKGWPIPKPCRRGRLRYVGRHLLRHLLRERNWGKGVQPVACPTHCEQRCFHLNLDHYLKIIRCHGRFVAAERGWP